MLTLEEDMYALLEVEVNTCKQSENVTLTQGGLTKKVMNTVGVLYSIKKTTPSETISLGTDAYVPPFDGPPFDEPW